MIVTIGDNRDYIKVLSYSYFTTITGRGVLLSYIEGYMQATPNRRRSILHKSYLEPKSM